ncbi:MAG: tRNA pseudouridine(38-40) synthase TruA [Cyclobacteriaceae bacterium]
MRYFMDMSYLGTAYHGWQLQDNAYTVQQEIEQALSTVLRVTTPVVASGRTDTGVHALQQIVHFDADEFDISQIHFKLNSLLPKDIAIKSLQVVKDDAHARFDAGSRSYEYHVHQEKNPFKIDLSYRYKPILDLDRINEACNWMKNWTDYQSFSKVKTDVNNYHCTITHCQWSRTTDGYRFDVSANRFLRNMIRAMVGTLIEIGLGKISVDEFIDILKAQHRSAAGTSVPACGLYLSKVEYPKDIYL